MLLDIVFDPQIMKEVILLVNVRKMNKMYWHIEGYEGTSKIFETEVKCGCFSDKQIQNLLMALTAKAGLNLDEIVGAYAKKRTKISNDLLLIQKEGPHPIYTCGINPYFIAQVVII